MRWIICIPIAVILCFAGAYWVSVESAASRQAAESKALDTEIQKIKRDVADTEQRKFALENGN